MQLAIYKGPANKLSHRLFHKAVCIVTGSIYSHAELIIDGVAYSASHRDKGVRAKTIDFGTGRWDVIDLPQFDELAAQTALAWFVAHDRQPYDIVGLFGFVVPWCAESPRKWFCSEAIAAALALPQPWRYSPKTLALTLVPVTASASFED